VNFVKKRVLLRNCSAVFIISTTLFFSGCGANSSQLMPSPKQLTEFQNAGPTPPKIDIERLLKARTVTGPYRVVPDDLLELQIPPILQVVTWDLPASQDISKPYLCRVSYDGYITVPVIGLVPVVEKTLTEIETAIVNAYYPKYCVDRPTVVARVAEYRTVKVSINGAVENPGVYELRSDQMSLVSLIMAAGGIVDKGAAAIRIERQEQPDLLALHQNPLVNTEVMELLGSMGVGAPQQTSDAGALVVGESEDKSLLLPVEGLNVPFADVPVREGDTIIVEQLGQPRFTVIGLVNKPGTFEYPPDINYNLMEALACAGGLHMAADPRYATVYRQKRDGTVVSAKFKVVEDLRLTDALSALVKPGDIIAVEQTQRTRTNLFFDKVFRINTGLYTTVRIIE
jgi:protein involved in polysaccharide export with SLBB domain